MGKKSKDGSLGHWVCLERKQANKNKTKEKKMLWWKGPLIFTLAWMLMCSRSCSSGNLNVLLTHALLAYALLRRVTCCVLREGSVLISRGVFILGLAFFLPDCWYQGFSATPWHKMTYVQTGYWPPLVHSWDPSSYAALEDKLFSSAEPRRSELQYADGVF